MPGWHAPHICHTTPLCLHAGAAAPTCAQSRAKALIAASTFSLSSLRASRSALSITSTKGRPAGGNGSPPRSTGPSISRGRGSLPLPTGRREEQTGTDAEAGRAACRMQARSGTQGGSACPPACTPPVFARNSLAASCSASAERRVVASGCCLWGGRVADAAGRPTEALVLLAGDAVCRTCRQPRPSGGVAVSRGSQLVAVPGAHPRGSSYFVPSTGCATVFRKERWS